jgi:predicted dehydrogenase
VLANWAPDRKQSIQELSPLRYKRILIEKPAASSLADVEWLSNHVKSAGISGAVNLHLRFSRLPEVISNLEIEYKLGKALKIFELGGAKCFSTNGIHWLDFAISRFSSDPVTVQSSNRFQKINPRSTNLYFVDGNAIWGFTDNRTFEISYSNDSSFPSRLLILYKHGLITVEEEKLILELQQNHIDDAEFPITRTTSPTGRIEIEDVFNWDSNEDGISRLYSVIFNEKCDIDDFLNSTRALLASFSASKTGLLKLLPKDWNDREEILNHDFFTDWQVT